MWPHEDGAAVGQAQLQRWQDASQPKQITLLVDEGQQVAAYKLLQCLSTEHLPLVKSAKDLHEVLDMVLLADQYQVEGIEAVCTAAVTRLESLIPITWAERVLQLSADCADKPVFQHIIKSIRVKLL